MLDGESRSVSSRKIAERVSQLGVWQDAQVIGLFASRLDEVDTSFFWTTGKRFTFPKVVGDTLQFVEVNGLLELKKRTYDLLEPVGKSELLPDLILVPGLAFDRTCKRLGRGKGFYDRWLEKHPTVTTIGICFETQIVEDVPAESHDERVDIVATENHFFQVQS